MYYVCVYISKSCYIWINIITCKVRELYVYQSSRRIKWTSTLIPLVIFITLLLGCPLHKEYGSLKP